jgi:ATP-binding cassette, subfamily B, bacterial
MIGTQDVLKRLQVSGGSRVPRRLSPYVAMLKYAARDRQGWALIVAVTLLQTFTAVLTPFPMKVLVDQALGGEPASDPLGALFASLPGGSQPEGLIVYAALAGLVIFALNGGLEVVSAISWVKVGQRMVYELAFDMFAKLQRRSITFHSRTSVGDMISRVSGDSWAVHSVVSTLLFAPVRAIVMIGAMTFVMFNLNPSLTGLVLVVAPIMAATTHVFGKPTRRISKRQRVIAGGLHAHVQRMLSGLPVVQVFGQEQREYADFSAYANDAVRTHQRSVLVSGLKDLGTGLPMTLGSAVVLLAGGRAVIDGVMTIGTLLVFVGYLAVLQNGFKALANVYIGLQAAGGSVDRVTEVLDAEPEVRDRPGAKPLPAVAGRIRFSDVVVGYEPGRPVLHDISFEVAPGETVALVGPTGAGKSTLVSLVPRLIDPWSGQVTVDGHDISGVQLRTLRSQVALVLQEPFLFPTTIAENIAYGRPDASRYEIEMAARTANAHAFIDRLDDGYDTILGERGATLSGGERQRLSIARALLRDAPILILDEPTSALDAETEHSLLQALERLMEGRTTLIIAHRLSTVRSADRILVLEDGRIAASGTHEELVSEGGLYAHLTQLQIQGHILDLEPQEPSPQR